jgi:hypothetical protein
MSGGLSCAIGVNQCINRAKKKVWTKSVWVEQLMGAKEPRAAARPSRTAECTGR